MTISVGTLRGSSLRPAWGVKIWAPQRARNTDGINPGNSTNVTIAHCFISTGDDHVAIKAGTGAPTTHISVVHNHFYAGHGIAVGSETNGGASEILVRDLSIDGADNGLHLKSTVGRGGLVRNVAYEDVCIRGTANPVMLETAFTAFVPGEGENERSALVPQFRDITVRDVKVEGAGKVTLEGVDEAHRLSVAFENVVFTDAGSVRVSVRHAEVKAAGLNLEIGGPDVSFEKAPGKPPGNACVGKFVEFPWH